MSNTMERRARKMDKKRFEAGVMLARMYGVAETLNPFDCLESKNFITKMEECTEEFLGLENADIVTFFESKIGK